MALWRDPLDELIEDLERAVPAKPGQIEYDFGPRLEDLHGRSAKSSTRGRLKSGNESDWTVGFKQ
jgi:hypothetical protein